MNVFGVMSSTFLSSGCVKLLSISLFPSLLGPISMSQTGSPGILCVVLIAASVYSTHGSSMCSQYWNLSTSSSNSLLFPSIVYCRL